MGHIRPGEFATLGTIPGHTLHVTPRGDADRLLDGFVVGRHCEDVYIRDCGRVRNLLDQEQGLEAKDEPHAPGDAAHNEL